VSSVSPRYAKALFALAKDGGLLEQTATEIERVAGLASDPQIGPVLGSPLLATESRRELVRTLAHELSLSDLLTRFLGLLAEHHRLAQLPGIARFFGRLLDAELGRARITVRSATALNDQHEAVLVKAFEQRTGKRILAQRVIDPDLLGGVVVEVEGTVYDGSVRTQLARLAKRLAGAAVL
jgi:F-type H+-transporting ATPase subunit delta